MHSTVTLVSGPRAKIAITGDDTARSGLARTTASGFFQALQLVTVPPKTLAAPQYRPATPVQEPEHVGELKPVPVPYCPAAHGVSVPAALPLLAQRRHKPFP